MPTFTKIGAIDHPNCCKKAHYNQVVQPRRYRNNARSAQTGIESPETRMLGPWKSVSDARLHKPLRSFLCVIAVFVFWVSQFSHHVTMDKLSARFNRCLFYSRSFVAQCKAKAKAKGKAKGQSQGKAKASPRPRARARPRQSQIRPGRAARAGAAAGPGPGQGQGKGQGSGRGRGVTGGFDRDVSAKIDY